MSTSKDTLLNGAAKSEKEKPQAPTQQQTQPLSNFVVSKDEKTLPLDERLHKLNLLFEIQGKYNRLQTSLAKLKTFKVKKNGESSSLRITDDNRNDFSTGNSDVIEEVIKFMISTIEKKIKELEPKLTW